MKKSVAIFILASGLALSAQSDVRFGVQGAVSLPTNDLSNNAYFGVQLGGHAKVDFHEGHGLMARADMTFYSQNNGVSVTDLALAGDYTFHFDRRQLGTYVLAGLSAQNYRTSFPGHAKNDNGLGLDLGLGYDVDRNLGLLARYTTNSFSGYNYSAFNLGVTYTF
jgi:hypothetical protein